MGIENELFKKDKKERYDLDKGSWGEIFGYNKDPFKIKDMFCDYILFEQEIRIKKPLCTCEEEWIKQIATDIWEWCGDDLIGVINDTSDEYHELWSEYKVTGNRFLNNEYQSEGYKNKYKEVTK